MSEEPLCNCQFPVPLTYNDATPVKEEKLTRVFAALNRQFGAYTVLGVRQGVWKGQVENMLWFEVAVPEGQVDQLKRVVRAIGRDLHQEAMYFNKGMPTVELIYMDDPPEDRS